MTIGIMIFTILFLASLILVCFFTVFDWKTSVLVPNHTDCLSFAGVNGVCNKVVVSTFSSYYI